MSLSTIKMGSKITLLAIMEIGVQRLCQVAATHTILLAQSPTHAIHFVHGAGHKAYASNAHPTVYKRTNFQLI